MSMKSECECAPTPKPTTSRPPPCESSRHCFCASVVPLRCVVQHVKRKLSKSAVYHYRRVCFGSGVCILFFTHRFLQRPCPWVCVWTQGVCVCGTVPHSPWKIPTMLVCCGTTTHAYQCKRRRRISTTLTRERMSSYSVMSLVLRRRTRLCASVWSCVCDNHEIRTWKRTFASVRRFEDIKGICLVYEPLPLIFFFLKPSSSSNCNNHTCQLDATHVGWRYNMFLRAFVHPYRQLEGTTCAAASPSWESRRRVWLLLF